MADTFLRIQSAFYETNCCCVDMLRSYQVLFIPGHVKQGRSEIGEG